MKKGPPPCGKCDKKGCGAYHDICPTYQKWADDEIDLDKPILREYLPDSLWDSRRKSARKRRT